MKEYYPGMASRAETQALPTIEAPVAPAGTETVARVALATELRGAPEGYAGPIRPELPQQPETVDIPNGQFVPIPHKRRHYSGFVR